MAPVAVPCMSPQSKFIPLAPGRGKGGVHRSGTDHHATTTSQKQGISFEWATCVGRTWFSRGVGGRDVLERPYTVGEGGGVPPPLDPPPLLPFQCLRLTAQILLRCQEDLSLEIFGPLSAGTIGGPKEEGGPSQTPLPPLQTPHPPLLIHPWWVGGWGDQPTTRPVRVQPAALFVAVYFRPFSKCCQSGAHLAGRTQGLV